MASVGFFFLLFNFADSRCQAQDPVAQILVTISGSDVASHPYGVLADDQTNLGYCTIAGDVTPFGESVESNANYRVAEIDLHSLVVLRTFEVGYFPTELLLVDEKLYVTCSNDSSLYQIDLPTGVAESYPMTDSGGFEVSYLSGLAAGDQGHVYIASNGGNFDGSDENVLVFDPVSQTIVNRIEVSGSITRILEHQGELVIPVGYPGNDFTAHPAVQWLDPVSGDVVASVGISVDTADFPGPSDIVPVGGNAALLTVFGGSSDVFLLDLENRSLTSSWPLGGGDFSQSAALPLPNGEVLISDLLGGWIKRLDPQDGSVHDFGSGLSQPADMAIHSGRIFVTEQGMEQVAVFLAPGSFLRGDSNLDLMLDVGDPITLLGYLFLGGDLECLDAGDFNDDGTLDISDAIGVLEFLFSEGEAPVFPYPIGGSDLQSDDLDCAQGA